MTIHHSIILILIGISISTNLLSQSPEYQFHPITKKNGLSNISNNSFVYKDSRDFWWISSMRGINRFDGQQVKSYEISEDGSFDENVQRNFFEEKNGNLWFSSFEGLHQYHGKTDKIISQKLMLGDEILQSAYHIFYIDREKEELWIKADQKILRYNIQSENTQFQFNGNGARFLMSPTTEQGTNRIFSFPWYNDKAFKIWQLNDSDQWLVENYDEGILGKSIIRQGLKVNNDLWLTSDNGLIQFDLVLNKTVGRFNPKEGITYFPYGIATQDNQLILSSKNNGLWQFDLNQKIFTQNWLHDATISNGLSTNLLSEVHLDNDQGIWITEPQYGVNLMLKKKPLFTNALEAVSSPAKIQHIIQDNENNVWVCNREQGIFVFGNSGKLIKRYKNINGNNSFSDAHLSIDQVGNIWIIINKNIFKSSKNGTWKLIYQSPENKTNTSIKYGYFNNPKYSNFDFKPSYSLYTALFSFFNLPAGFSRYWYKSSFSIK